MDFIDVELPYDEAENYFQSSNKQKLNSFSTKALFLKS